MKYNDYYNLTENLERKIFSETIVLSEDFTEFALDVIIKNDLLKEIPVLNYLVCF